MSTTMCGSWKDLFDNVIVPSVLNEEVAEFIGIFTGDGHIEHRSRLRNGKFQNVYEMTITGNIKDEKYYVEYVNPLIKNIFNTAFNIKRYPEKNAIVMTKNSKSIHSYISSEFCIPSQKNNICIPSKIILANQSIKKAFLRGLFDADFCLVIKNKPNPYPVVQGSAKSKQLILQVKELLREMGLESCTVDEKIFYERRNRTYYRTSIFINGRIRVNKYLKLIGFSNPNKTKKYLDSIKLFTPRNRQA